MATSPTTTGTAPAWELEGHVARPRPTGPDGGARIDLSAPPDGLAIARGDRLLGIDAGVRAAPIDSWVRGDDVTATWRSADARGLSVTARWRVLADAVGGPDGVEAWEIVASATTDRLHADASLAVTSEIAADEVLAASWEGRRCGPFDARAVPARDLFLVRRGGTSVLLAVHPDETHLWRILRRDGRIGIDCLLFPAGVEKGVLLRSRVLAARGPAAGDLAWATSLADRFGASPPELST